LVGLPPSEGALVIAGGPVTDGAENAAVPEVDADVAPGADLEPVEPELEAELSAALMCPGEAKIKSAARKREMYRMKYTLLNFRQTKATLPSVTCEGQNQ